MSQKPFEQIFQEELLASEAACALILSTGGAQFDGDPHWDNAMKALADAAIADAEKLKNAPAEAGTAG